MTQSLATGYEAEVDTVDPRTWYDVVAGFSDANLYQLWQQGAGRERFTEVSRIAITQEQRVAAAAEVRLFRVPLVTRGIAYVLWGPLYKRGDLVDPSVFRQALRALRNEYVLRRGMVLRISPRALMENGVSQQILIEEGFSLVEHVRQRKSLFVDLSPSMEELRRDLDKKWRNSLSKAERSALTISSGTSLELFDEFMSIYTRMLQRKRFTPSADILKHRRIQQDLPEHLKMRVVLASHDGHACAGAIYSALGDTAVYLFGATDETGMHTSGSYLVQWDVLKTLKQEGFKSYDLNGVDAVSNPGTYHFKRGLAGRRAEDVTFLGQFQAAESSLANYSLLFLDRLRHKVRASRSHRGELGSSSQS